MRELKELRFFGRRQGKTLKTSKKKLLDELLPQLTPVLPESGKIDAAELFSFTPQSLSLEIGFGGGEHLAELSEKYPNIGFIGAEPFMNGVASLLAYINGSHTCATTHTDIAPNRVDNVRIWPDDVRDLFGFFNDKVFQDIYLLYPDPWPKARHVERRFTNHFNQAHLYRLLKDDGSFFVATDVEQYALWTQEKVIEVGLFEQINDNIYAPPPDWVPTRYEKKGILAGRQPIYLVFKKKVSK